MCRRPDAEELALAGEPPAAMAVRLAVAKARSVAAPNALVIGSDQVASLDGGLLRKPGGRAAALRQLQACQGKMVVFDTAAVVLDTATGVAVEHVDRTEVHFASLETAALDRYVRREQPYDCAGSFKAEGLGAGALRAHRLERPHGVDRLAADLAGADAQGARRRSLGPGCFLTSSAVSTARRSSGKGELAENGSSVSGHVNDSECACRNVRFSPNVWRYALKSLSP